MALSKEAVEFKRLHNKPTFYCPSKKHYLSRNVLEPKYIHPCNIKNCECRGNCGWVATCNLCGDYLHYCLWGCSYGIPIDKYKMGFLLCDPHSNKPIENKIRFHGYTYHFGGDRSLEYDTL